MNITQWTPVSAANKLTIRCAWAGTPAFASAGYGSGWAPESYIFADKASLRTAATEYVSNAAAATAKYGTANSLSRRGVLGAVLPGRCLTLSAN